MTTDHTTCLLPSVTGEQHAVAFAHDHPALLEQFEVFCAHRDRATLTDVSERSTPRFFHGPYGFQDLL